MRIRAPKLKRSLENDNYISGGVYTVTIGSGTGVINVGTLAINDYILNNFANIATGGAINQRLGNKLYFTTLKVRMFANIPNGGRLRVIVGKSMDPKAALQVNNTALTAYIEGTTVLEPPLVAVSSAVGVSDYLITNAGEFKILYDKNFVNTNGAATSNVPVEFTVPIKLLRGYDNSTNVIEGSWFLYMASPGYVTSSITGTVKLNWENYAN